MSRKVQDARRNLHVFFWVKLSIFGGDIPYKAKPSIVHLVGGFNPLKNISQNGNLPQIGVKKKISETTT